MLTEVMPRSETGEKSTIFRQTALAATAFAAGGLLLTAFLVVWILAVGEGVNHDHLEIALIAAAFAALGLGAHAMDGARAAETARRHGS